MAEPISGLFSLGAQGLGSVFNAFGASKREDAIRNVAGKAEDRTLEFTNQFTGESSDAKKRKDEILSSSDDVFDRIGGFIFGQGDSISNLRKAQENFSEAAAGNFENFNQETQALVSSALAGTYGGPQGSFENISAKNLFDFRSQGLQNATSITNTFANLGGDLINTEFGIMDQDFERRLGLRQYQTEKLNEFDFMKANAAGSTEATIGSGLSQIGQGINSYNTGIRLDDIAAQNAKNSKVLNKYYKSLTGQINKGNMGGYFVPPVATSSLPSWAGPSDAVGLSSSNPAAQTPAFSNRVDNPFFDFYESRVLNPLRDTAADMWRSAFSPSPSFELVEGTMLPSNRPSYPGLTSMMTSFNEGSIIQSGYNNLAKYLP